MSPLDTEYIDHFNAVLIRYNKENKLINNIRKERNRHYLRIILSIKFI